MRDFVWTGIFGTFATILLVPQSSPLIGGQILLAFLDSLPAAPAVVKRMRALVNDAVTDPTVRQALARQGMTPQTMAPAVLRAHRLAYRERRAAWTRTADIEPE
ncbi:hypothetical protein [Cupriavidus sp. UYPR2.512]|uniref:hypothetical protein n=1 Tax=Cupriavidus sp. UYPR2.512 TaxID=1080187 RepID=UPI00039A16C0|nr:hypothetical protein [Cupriavidus sp. UYPR2.512]UIF86291.1 hypothetical protein KAF44_00895 [Cupriavidus necator]